jgi:uncharacterized membrane protein
MADLLVQIIGCRLGPTVQETGDRTARAIVPDRDVAYYLELSCGQVRRYGRHEPTVLVALPRVLRDAAAANRDDDHQRQAIAAEVQRILDSADQTLLDQERESVADMAARVHAALDGHILEVYTDRSGETRSI